MKEINEHINKCQALPCSLVGRLNLLQMLIVSKLFYKFKAIPIKIQAGIFWGGYKPDNSKIYKEKQRN